MTSRLQQEIKQTKPFPSVAAEALLSVLRTAAVVNHAVSEALRPLGLTPTQHNVLRILRGAGNAGLCGREVGERLVAQVPDVSRLLERMEEMGLVSRERDADDRRHVTARITPKGLRLLSDVEPALTAVERRLLGSVARADLSSLIATLDAVRAAA